MAFLIYLAMISENLSCISLLISFILFCYVAYHMIFIMPEEIDNFIKCENKKKLALDAEKKIGSFSPDKLNEVLSDFEIQENKIDTLKYKIKRAIIFMIICLFTSSVLPSKNTIYLMVGINKIQETQIIDKTVKLLNKKLDQYNA